MSKQPRMPTHTITIETLCTGQQIRMTFEAVDGQGKPTGDLAYCVERLGRGGRLTVNGMAMNVEMINGRKA